MIMVPIYPYSFFLEKIIKYIRAWNTEISTTKKYYIICRLMLKIQSKETFFFFFTSFQTFKEE